MILWSKTDRIAQVGRDAGRSLANLLHKARSVWGQVIQGFIYPHLEILHGLRQYDSLWTQMQDLCMVCKVLWVEDLVISLTLLAMLNAAQDVVEFSLLAGRTAGLHAAWSPCPLESFSAVLTLSQFSLHQCQGRFLPKCGFLHLPLHLFLLGVSFRLLDDNNSLEYWWSSKLGAICKLALWPAGCWWRCWTDIPR